MVHDGSDGPGFLVKPEQLAYPLEVVVNTFCIIIFWHDSDKRVPTVEIEADSGHNTVDKLAFALIFYRHGSTVASSSSTFLGRSSHSFRPGRR